jgi:MoaA/NifB/PqqE/SkfB family radical SAM enzyme
MRKPPIITNPLFVWFIRLIIQLSFIKNAYLAYKSVTKARRTLSDINNTLQKAWGKTRLEKFIRIDGKYYWNYTAPHWPSAIQKDYLWGELNRIVPFQKKKSGLRVLYFAMTSACPLNCEHCLEWDRLNSSYQLDIEDMIEQIHEFQQSGVAQVQLTGGEPLVRFNDLVSLVAAISDKSDVWVLTSGHSISSEKISKLKTAGLTGISFSLDHFAEDKHDQFRGRQGVYEDALSGAEMAFDAGLLVCFSICTTRDFISKENLLSYAELAKETGASFINILEPKATGRYKNQDVKITRAQEQVLEDFYFDMNFAKKYMEYPIVAYPDFQFRKLGCMGGGNRVLYINSSGEVNACPFCQNNKTNIKSDSIENILNELSKTECENFASPIV